VPVTPIHICSGVRRRSSGGSRPILDIVPSAIHARVPLVFGSPAKVELVGHYHSDPQFFAEHAPLFGKRGLMRL
jgi:fructose-1,6-bisphosphatase I